MNESEKLNVIVIERSEKGGGEALVDEEKLLVKLAVRGDAESLAELLRRSYAFLYQYVLKATMHKARAEDITQETMLRAIEKIATFQARSSFSTWLISIASRLMIDRARRSERERKWLEEEKGLHSLRYDMLMKQSDWPDALDALGGLPDSVRIPVLLKYYYGYEQNEIAAMLDIPAGTVKSRLHNGLKALRKEMAGHVGQDEERAGSTMV